MSLRGTARRGLSEHHDGFTLIELLVVIAIVGILASIAIPVFLGQRRRAVDISLKADLRNAILRMETYYGDYQGYGATGVCPTGTRCTGSGTALDVPSYNTSPGNSVGVQAVTASGYCLASYNVTGVSSSKFYYNSQQGGLLPDGSTGCGILN